ncbi:MAG: hypothetical protein ACE5ID_03735 [Acidobacteriota bacterium]
MVHRFWFVCDDAWISFRFARNWAAGYGVRYNLGPHVPVEGYSNFLWVALAAVCEFLGAAPEFWMPVVSCGCALALLLAVYRALTRDLETGREAALLTCAALAWSPVFAVWSTGGLETMAAALCLFLCFERWVLAPRETSLTGGCMAALALSLLRTEGLFWVAMVAALALLMRTRSGRPFRRLRRGETAALLGAVFTYAAYTAWRVHTYHSWLSNTAKVKADLGLETAGQGLVYAIALLLALVTPLIFYMGSWPAVRRHGRRGLALVIMALAPLAYAIIVGGDYMTMGRLFLPALPPATLLLGIGIDQAFRRFSRKLVLAGMAALLLAGAAPAFDYHLVPRSVRSRFHFRQRVKTFRSEYQQWRYQCANVARWKEEGLVLRQVTQPGDSYVAGAIGAAGYFSDLFIYDRGGLVSRDVAERPLAGDRDLKSPGHEKIVPYDFFLDRDPTILKAALVNRKNLRRQAMKLLRTWRREPRVISRYAPRLDPAGDSDSTFLIQLRLMPEGRSAEKAWAEFPGRVKALSSAGASQPPALPRTASASFRLRCLAPGLESL